MIRSAPEQLTARITRLATPEAVVSTVRRLVHLTSGGLRLKGLERAIGTFSDPIDVPIAALIAARPDIVILHGPQ